MKIMVFKKSKEIFDEVTMNRLWKIAKNNTVTNEQGLTVIPKGDEWEEEEWEDNLDEKEQDKIPKPQEIWYANYPYEDNLSVQEDRPVLVLSSDKDNVLFMSMKITKNLDRYSKKISGDNRNNYDIPLWNWREEGLKYPSVARVDKIMTIPKEQFRRKIGDISRSDWRNIERELKRISNT